MAFGDVVRTGTGSGTSGNASANFSSGTATAGNLIIFTVARSTSHSLGGSWGTPSGFAALHNSGIQNGNMGSAAWYKIAAGGESGASVAGTNEAGNWTASIIEFEGPFDSGPLDKQAENEANLASTTNTISSGTTATTVQADQLAVAMFAVDSGGNLGTSRSYTNSFVERIVGLLGGRAAHTVASRVLSAIGAYETTISYTAGGGNDEMYAQIATFRAVPPASDPPTTVLVSPADTSTVNDTTPTVQVEATDPESDDVRYQVQIATASDFEHADGIQITDSYSSAGSGAIHPAPMEGTTWQGNPQIDDRPGQSFTGEDGWLNSITLLGLNPESDSPDGTAYIRVYAHQGTFGTSSEPLNAADAGDTPTPDWLAISDGVVIDGDSVTGDFEFAFSGANRIKLVNGTRYVFILDWVPNTTASTNTFVVQVDSTTAAHAGNLYNDGGSANNGPQATWDMKFEVEEEHVFISALSGTDPGFVNTEDGGDTDPFTEDQVVSYTVQAADELPEGLYYWRARASDPFGSGSFGSWATTRSFTVDTGGGTTYEDDFALSQIKGAAPSVILDAGSAVSLRMFANSLQSTSLNGESSFSVEKVANIATSGNLSLYDVLDIEKISNIATELSLTVEGNVSLNGVRNIFLDADLTIDQAITLGHLLNLAREGSLSIDASFPLRTVLNIIQRGGLSVDSAISLSSARNTSPRLQVILEAISSLGRSANIVVDSALELSSDLSLGSVLSIVQESANIIDSTVTLGGIHNISVSGGVLWLSNLSLGREQNVFPADELETDVEVVLGIHKKNNIVLQSLMVANNSVTLRRSDNVLQDGTLIIDQGVSVHRLANIVASGGLLLADSVSFGKYANISSGSSVIIEKEVTVGRTSDILGSTILSAGASVEIRSDRTILFFDSANIEDGVVIGEVIGIFSVSDTPGAIVLFSPVGESGVVGSIIIKGIRIV